MGRTARVNLPGAPFHLIARLQDGKPLFLGSEAEIVATLSRTIRESDVRLLAYAMMSNHLHLVVVQGRKPLSQFMQQLLRRIALYLQRRHELSGHVFQGRYRAYACLDARHLRAVLCYVHLNPVRAGICRDAIEYTWTSHGAYCGRSEAAADLGVDIEFGLRLFANRDTGPPNLRRCYLRYIAWRSRVDELEKRLDREEAQWVDRPITDLGDDLWWSEFGQSAVGYAPGRLRRPDLERIAKAVIGYAAPGMSLDELRSGNRTAHVTVVRGIAIERAVAAGYANYQIARYLRISPSTVSRVISSLRERTGGIVAAGRQHS
jgi:REP element-mobilizing transposase RayT